MYEVSVCLMQFVHGRYVLRYKDFDWRYALRLTQFIWTIILEAAFGLSIIQSRPGLSFQFVHDLRKRKTVGGKRQWAVCLPAHVALEGAFFLCHLSRLESLVCVAFVFPTSLTFVSPSS
jgi:hypothetical protein